MGYAEKIKLPKAGQEILSEEAVQLLDALNKILKDVQESIRNRVEAPCLSELLPISYPKVEKLHDQLQAGLIRGARTIVISFEDVDAIEKVLSCLDEVERVQAQPGAGTVVLVGAGAAAILLAFVA